MVASFSLTITCVRKFLVWLLGFRYRIGNALVFYALSKCVSFNLWFMLSKCVGFSLYFILVCTSIWSTELNEIFPIKNVLVIRD